VRDHTVSHKNDHTVSEEIVMESAKKSTSPRCSASFDFDFATISV